MLASFLDHVGKPKMANINHWLVSFVCHVHTCAFSPLVVATNDERIAECCRGFGANVIMTSESCKNGTDCVVL